VKPSEIAAFSRVLDSRIWIRNNARVMGSPIYLRTARERRNWTQQQLERESGVAQNTISKLENSPRARPSYAIVDNLARALGVHPSTLRFGPDPHPDDDEDPPSSARRHHHATS